MADSPPLLSVEQNIKPRLDRITDIFFKHYDKRPVFYARASGRVNLIGEHIDYCGYAVLPMAIEQDIIIAVAKNEEKKIRLINTNADFVPYEELATTVASMTIDKNNPQWHHYFICGYKGILEHFGLPESVGLDLILDGTIPKSAGLSSSSAFVCSAALATMHANGKQCTKLELADICQHCERYIGTEGGGMDQSIAFLAQPGTAKLIEFNPIRATDVKLPAGAVFVISNSCVEMNKAATSHYNIRVAECRLGAQIMTKAQGRDWRKIRKLGDLQSDLGVTLEDMVALVQETLHPQPYSKQEVCDILGVTAEELNQTSLNEKTIGLEEFLLFDRALHVYTEANRVLQFKATCDEKSQQEGAALQHLGRLMNESHASCRDQYQCSCMELDQLTQLARESGALGSRLTGAGWGGCAVSLVPTDKLASFLQLMQGGYYAADPSRKAKVKDSLFTTQPGGGACIYIP